MYQEHGAGVVHLSRNSSTKTPGLLSLQFQQNNHKRGALSNFTGRSLQQRDYHVLGMVLTFNSLDETLVCDHLNESY